MLTDKRYLNRDVEAIRAELYEIIKQRTSAWTDFNSGGFESHIIDLVAGLSDMLSYYIDNSIQESYLMSARQPKNIRGILQTMNYFVDNIGPARGKITVERQLVSLDVVWSGRFTLPKWTNISNSYDREVNYVTTEACQFLSTDLKKDVPIVEGRIVEDNPTVALLRRDYKYFITDENIPIEYVYIDDDTWVKVDDAFLEIDGGKKYSVHKDHKNRTYILFSWDWRQYLSSEDTDTVNIKYLVTKGGEGTVNARYLDRIIDDLVDDEGNPITTEIKCYNESPTYGAFTGVDLNLHKANAMRNFRTMDRIILLDDFEAKIRKEPWVLDCVVYDWRKDYTICPMPHKLMGWVVTVDGIDTNQEILDELRDKLMKITVEMTDIEIRCAEYVDVPIVMNICVKGSNDYRENIRKQVEDKVKETYSVSNLKFGMTIEAEDIEDIATRYAGTVRFPEVTSFEGSIVLEPTQFPRISKVEVNLVGDSYGRKDNN